MMCAEVVGMEIKVTLSAILILFLLGPAKSWTEPDIGDVKYPRLSEGQIFSIKLIPGSRSLAVYVVGKPVAAVKWKDIGLTASTTVDGRNWTFASVREGDHFILKPPPEFKMPETFDLKMRVRHDKKSEDFTFPAVPGPL